MGPDNYLTIQEAAGALRCHVKTIRRRITDGELRAARNGRRILIPRDVIAAFLSSRPVR